MCRSLIVLPLFVLSACGSPGGVADGNDAPADSSALTLQAIEQRILAAPTDPAAFAARARYFEQLDSVSAAVNDWKRAMALAPTDPKWPIALGDLYYQVLRLEEADEILAAAAALDTTRSEALLKRSEIKLIRREYKEAMSLANEALRKDELNAQGYYLKGWIHRESGDTALAISSYRTAVEQDPTFYDAFVALGLLHAAKHDPLALQYYNSAIDIRPRSVEAWYDRGMYCQEHGQDSLALISYARIKEIAPTNALAYYNTGYILLEHQRRTREARAEFTKAIALLPDHAPSYYNRGLTYELEDRLDSALADYREALRVLPTFDLPALGLSRLQAKGARVPLPRACTAMFLFRDPCHVALSDDQKAAHQEMAVHTSAQGPGPRFQRIQVQTIQLSSIQALNDLSTSVQQIHLLGPRG
jgi:tetratricopeptide (TPR) repeat protein